MIIKRDSWLSRSLFASLNKWQRRVLQFCLSVVLIGMCVFNLNAKIISDFNENWLFTLDKQQAAHQFKFDDTNWQPVDLPHDWAVALPYTKEGAASTGFKLGGIGWYRKYFEVTESDLQKQIWLEFDGIYNNSEIWLNGHYVGGRPNGYTSFNVDISPYIKASESNVVSVKVDRTAYADSRWYTGSGIYRDVRIVKANKVYIPQWGIQVKTPTVKVDKALVDINIALNALNKQGDNAMLFIALKDINNKVVAKTQREIRLQSSQSISEQLTVKYPALWDIDSPNLYTAHVTITHQNQEIAADQTRFGIRSIEFDPKKGFFLNNRQTKIKGVNLHHDAGAIGVAVPKSVWAYRLAKLKQIGVNAIRMSHNPHSPDLLDLCDEMGFLVNAESFDDWDRPKGKSKAYLGDNKATGASAQSYSEHFNVWAERDLKDLIKRDFNNPSIIMWSIGNEIEWTYKYYPQSVSHHEDGTSYYEDAPDFDKQRIMDNIKKFNPDKEDNLVIIAKQLSGWVKDIDTTRPVTAGLTHPSVGFATGYTDALDIVGFNYRAAAYQKAHETYPDQVIYGSENWGAWREWRDVVDKDYIAGIFIWTGFAYKGEAGPLPRMGLDISLFDFAGNKTPRGHFFETLWNDTPKTYVGTTLASQSEFSFDKTKGWTFTPRKYPDYIWDKIRMWEWYDINESWQYNAHEQIVVQSYTNTEEVELFINGRSQGKLTLLDFDDRVIKWLVPYQAGELKVVGYNKGKPVTESIINTPDKLAKIELSADKNSLTHNANDTLIVHAVLVDQQGNRLALSEDQLQFIVDDSLRIIGVDNGSENNIQDVLTDTLNVSKGRAIAHLQLTDTADNKTATIKAKVGDITSDPLIINVK
ncbi:sugar-binding domain-containing protein [Algibacillus agarilyticus]|uniref:sugar-binding domain-containing protein n=1 Tax=Algibacillus agarilyticus TaxID=2234133 RepID=UPI001E52256D|nr:sugar-binding domain-containing protein [Algibacillus agarilyticus]